MQPIKNPINDIFNLHYNNPMNVSSYNLQYVQKDAQLGIKLKMMEP